MRTHVFLEDEFRKLVTLVRESSLVRGRIALVSCRVNPLSRLWLGGFSRRCDEILSLSLHEWKKR